MSVSIVPCPECDTLLLSDTAQCPTCKHVFDADRVIETADLSTESEIPQSSQEIPCPDCGEMCRPELVRCYNCGGFIRSEIAESYQRMQEKMLSEFTNESPAGDQPDSNPPSSIDTPESTADEEGDFELAAGVSAEDDDFELAPGIDVDDDDFDLSPEIETASTPVTPPAQSVTPPPALDDEIELVTDPPVESLPSQTKPAEAAATAPPATDDLDDIPTVAAQTETDSKEGLQPVEEIPEIGNSESSSPTEGGKTSDAEGTPQTGEAEEPSSLAPSGDVLLDIAMKEEKEVEERKKNRPKRKLRVRTGFIVFCPNGHQVEVQEKHRGKMGKCPKCKSPFLVPQANWEKKESESEQTTSDPTGDAESATAEQTAATMAETSYRWMTDVHVHTVDPTKMKLKVGSLELAFETFDFGFNKETGLLSVSLVKGGMFGAADKKKPEAREALLSHLAENNPLDELPVADRKQFDTELLSQIKIVQPAANADESMFAGIPVFGEYRIAARLPKLANDDPLTFASFALSEFREFTSILTERFEIEGLADSFDIPLTDSFEDFTCHYSDEPLPALKNLEWYQADSNFELNLIGHKCQGCGLTVSEDSRKKEKIGGANGKGIAKAKCPKCQAKFGDTSLYALAEHRPTPIEDSTETEEASS